MTSLFSWEEEITGIEVALRLVCSRTSVETNTLKERYVLAIPKIKVWQNLET